MRTTSLVFTIFCAASVDAWCPRGTWQDQNGHCHTGNPPGSPIGYQPANGAPTVFYNGVNPNVINQPGTTFVNNGYNGQTAPNGGINPYGDNINWIQSGYTKYNNPGLFFDNYKDQGWNPFRGMNSLPFVNVGWSEARHLRTVHGVMAGISFVGLFPFGAVAAAVLPGMIGLGVHVALQMLGFLFYLIAFAMGIWIANTVRFGYYNLYQNYHPIIGIIVFILIFFQPFTGAAHHIGFRRNNRRGISSYLHVWLGRIAIILGMINGGLGLYVSGNATSGQIMAYALLTAVVFVIWMLAAAFGAFRKHRRDVPRRPKRRSDSPAMTSAV